MVTMHDVDEPVSPDRGGGLVRLRIDLGYDGTEFAGWAVQPGLRTVQGELEKALSILHAGHAVSYANPTAPGYGSSRSRRRNGASSSASQMLPSRWVWSPESRQAMADLLA